MVVTDLWFFFPFVKKNYERKKNFRNSWFNRTMKHEVHPLGPTVHLNHASYSSRKSWTGPGCSRPRTSPGLCILRGFSHSEVMSMYWSNYLSYPRPQWFLTRRLLPRGQIRDPLSNNVRSEDLRSKFKKKYRTLRGLVKREAVDKRYRPRSSKFNRYRDELLLEITLLMAINFWSRVMCRDMHDII